jgi:glucans biosynthesis protein C
VHCPSSSLTPMNHSSTTSPRLLYLDWLRVIAFSILLFEHCAEIFVPWKFWVKNLDTSESLGYFIAFLKPWRMPLLFIISGAAVYLACKRKTSGQIFRERFNRILLPLLAAMILIIPPQIYFIRMQEGAPQTIWQFYQTLFQFSWFPAGNLHWLHLWYLAFIFGFTLLVIPVLPKMRMARFEHFLNRSDAALKHPVMLTLTGLLISLPFYFVNNYVASGNIAQLTYYFPYFIFGLTVFLRPHIQRALLNNKGKFLTLSVLVTTFLYILSFRSYDGEMLLKQAVNDEHRPFHIFAVQSLNTWLWLLSILGYSIKLLNFRSKRLTYANEAVYPFYILHQTVIVAVGYYIVRLDASITLKLILITISSFTAIWVFYEYVIRRRSVTRLIFGLKGKRAGITPEPQAGPKFNIPAGQVRLADDLKSTSIPVKTPVG